MREKVKKKRDGLTERLKKRDAAVWRRRSVALCREAGYTVTAFLLGQAVMIFDTSPLGLSILCAGSGHTLAILVGLLLSAFALSDMTWIYIVTYLAAAVVRIVSGALLDAPDDRERLRREADTLLEHSRDVYGEDGDPTLWQSFCETRVGRSLSLMLSVVFHEKIRLRMATAAICSLIVSLYRVISGGFLYYDWFAALFCAIAVPAAVMVYSVYLDGEKRMKWMYFASAGMLMYSVVWSADGVTLSSFSIPFVLAIFLTLYTSRLYGVALGCVAGVICGVAIDFLYAPAFLIGALVFSFYQGRKKNASGILPAVLCAMIWLLYISGVWNLAVLFPSLLLGGAIFTPVCVYLHAKEEIREEERREDEATAVRSRFAGRQHEKSNAHLREISEAFSELSEMFYNLSDRFRRPGTLDLRRICDRSFDTHCADCPNKTVCWGLEYSETLAAVNRLISCLHTRGRVTREELSSHLSKRCESTDAILEDINRNCARLTAELLRNNRTEIFAMDYEAAAKIINDALEEDDGEYRFSEELEQQIAEYLRDAGVRTSGVTVYGERRRQILVRGVDVEHATVTAETMRSDLGEMCGLYLSRPSFEVEGGVSTMLLQARKKISVDGAQNNVSADGGVSGDTVNLFSNKKDYFYALINDGMGSGNQAALTSNLCSVFLEKMLRAGNRAGTSLRMLNNLIRSRSADSTDECSSTVDLLELDLVTGEASFIKSGASPSFVVRGGTVHRLQSGTAPIGIIKKLDTQIKPYNVRVGDILVMISDGIEQNDPECKWLVSYLSSCGDASAEEIVYQICLHAAESENHDDCSAIALRIVEAGEE